MDQPNYFTSDQVQSGNTINAASPDLTPPSNARIGQQYIKPQAIKTTAVSKLVSSDLHTSFDPNAGALIVTDPTTKATITLGIQADGSLGLSIIDSDGFTLFSLNGQTWSWNDKTTAKNVMQLGKLPDGTYGFVVAKTNQNVSDAFL